MFQFQFLFYVYLVECQVSFLFSKYHNCNCMKNCKVAELWQLAVRLPELGVSALSQVFTARCWAGAGQTAECGAAAQCACAARSCCQSRLVSELAAWRASVLPSLFRSVVTDWLSGTFAPSYRCRLTTTLGKTEAARWCEPYVLNCLVGFTSSV